VCPQFLTDPIPSRILSDAVQLADRGVWIVTGVEEKAEIAEGDGFEPPSQ
jgi:hypothetical protein